MRLWLSRLLAPRGYSLVPTPWIDGSWEKSAISACYPGGPQFEVVGRTIERMDVATTLGGEVLRIFTSAASTACPTCAGAGWRTIQRPDLSMYDEKCGTCR